MSTKTDVLSMLEHDRSRFISGQELAQMLKVSRTAVWKAVKSLQEDGHKVLAVTNKGYMLETGSDLLSEEGLRIRLPEKYRDCEILVYSTIDSTNTQAKKLALDKAMHGTIILAEEQTAGRGRYGKSFFSPRGEGLYLSLILKPDKGASDTQMITVAAAVAVCRAIEKLTDKKPQIKWVNDIFLDGKKICGILSEAVTDFESGSVESIVVGVGVDCAVNEKQIPEELRAIIGSLDAFGLSRNALAAEIAGEILELFVRLGDRGIIDDYRARSLMLGRDISFVQGSVRKSAKVKGISDNGGLIVKLENGDETTLCSGEVTIRGLQKQ